MTSSVTSSLTKLVCARQSWQGYQVSFEFIKSAPPPVGRIIHRNSPVGRPSRVKPLEGTNDPNLATKEPHRPYLSRSRVRQSPWAWWAWRAPVTGRAPPSILPRDAAPEDWQRPVHRRPHRLPTAETPVAAASAPPSRSRSRGDAA